MQLSVLDIQNQTAFNNASFPHTPEIHARFGNAFAIAADTDTLFVNTGRERLNTALTSPHDTYIVLDKNGNLFAGLQAHKGPWGSRDPKFLETADIKDINRNRVLFNSADLDSLRENIDANGHNDIFDGAIIVRVNNLTYQTHLNAGDFVQAQMRADSFVINTRKNTVVLRGHLTAAITMMSGQLEAPLNNFKRSLSALSQTNMIRVINPRPRTKRFG